MAKTIFNITREDLNPKEFEALQEKARDFLGVPEKEEVKETQGQVVQKVEEKLEEGDFGAPDTKQQEILDKMPEELKERLKGRLFFREDTTEIIINTGKLVFDKQQKFTDSCDWETAIKNVESIGQRLPTKEEFEGLFDLFKIGKKYYGDELKNILNIAKNTYWSISSHNGYYRYDAFVCNFYNHSIRTYHKNNKYFYILHVYN